jgi:hypothetical protein
MSAYPSGANVNTVAFGNYPENVEVPHIDIRDPAPTDYQYPLGKRWINRILNTSWELTSISAFANVTSGNWEQSGGSGTGLINTINLNAPIAGNYTLAGTANQIAVAQTAGTTTFTIPSVFIAPGSIAATTSITAGTTLTATLGNITATNGNIVLGTTGNKQVYTTVGSTATAVANSAGSVALIGGTITVTTTAVTANSLIRLTCQALGTVTVPSALCVSAKTAATSFVILASQATDTSTIFWEIVN